MTYVNRLSNAPGHAGAGTARTTQQAHEASVSAAGVDIAIVRDLAFAEQRWRALERRANASAYQMFDLVAAWQRHCAEAAGITPMVVIGTYADGGTAFIIPLGQHRWGPVTVAGWLGDKHSNFNLALIDPDYAPRLSAADVRDIFSAIKRLCPQLDAFDLNNQPESWAGIRNPFALLCSQESPSAAYSTALPDNFDRLMGERRGGRGRKRLRWQTKRLSELGELRFFKAANQQEAHRILDAFLTQRRARMRFQRIANPFERPQIQAMLRDLASATTGGQEDALQLFALEVGGRIVATYGGGQVCGRFSAAFNSFDMSLDIRRFSPGELLLQHLLAYCIDNKMQSFDLGSGRADYKLAWCDTRDVLMDTLYPVSSLGAVYCALRSVGLNIKRMVKNSPLLWRWVQTIRRHTGGHNAPYRDVRH